MFAISSRYIVPICPLNHTNALRIALFLKYERKLKRVFTLSSFILFLKKTKNEAENIFDLRLQNLIIKNNFKKDQNLNKKEMLFSLKKKKR